MGPKVTYQMNEHLFYVVNHDIDKRTLITSFKEYIEKQCKKIKKAYRCEYRFNQVTDRQGKNLGHGYLWISSPEVFRMLTGKNPDGTERVEEKFERDPKVLEARMMKELEEFISRPDEQLDKLSWADLQEIEDAIKERYKPVLSRKKLPPLIDLDAFTNNYPGLVITPFITKDHGFTNIYCPSIPQWVTKDQIVKEFQPFSSKKIEVVISGRDRKSCQVVFDKRRPDAQIALAMKTKIYLPDPKTKELKTIIFREDRM